MLDRAVADGAARCNELSEMEMEEFSLVAELKSARPYQERAGLTKLR